ncbi:hypothetical protein BKA62DRAFT_830742 [Auriculariales sp. MPI-PUGE-AT-0066]|nr:hypothetical protein BKA62DRAFT_830742 [Auriculariales sp. MPI-PUGE-AT-0066]
MSLVPYQLPLSAVSGIWRYFPDRNGLPEKTWNASYTDESTWPQQKSNIYGQGSFYFRTQAAGSRVAMNFTGTGLVLCFSDNGAAHSIILNASPVTLIPSANDQSCTELGASSAIAIHDLEFTTHNIELTISGASPSREFQFYGGTVETKVLVDSPSDAVSEITIDDRDSDWVQGQPNSHWAFTYESGLEQGTGSFTCSFEENAAGSASYTFKGASAVLMNSGGSDSYTILFDGKTFISSLAASYFRLPTTPMFFQTGLDPSRSYTIVVMNYDPADLRCRHLDGSLPDNELCCTCIDSIHLLGSKVALAGGPAISFPGEDTLSSSSSPSSSVSGTTSPRSTYGSAKASPNIAAIAGGVVGGCVVIILVGIALRVVLVRRHRRRYLGDTDVLISENSGVFRAFQPSSHPSATGSVPPSTTQPPHKESTVISIPRSSHIGTSTNSYESAVQRSIGAPAHPPKDVTLLLRGSREENQIEERQSATGARTESLPPYTPQNRG